MKSGTGIFFGGLVLIAGLYVFGEMSDRRNYYDRYPIDEWVDRSLP